MRSSIIWMGAAVLSLVSPASPMPAPPTLEAVVDVKAPLYQAQLRGASGVTVLRLKVRPEVRSVAFRFFAESHYSDTGVVKVSLEEHSVRKPGETQALFVGAVAPESARFPGAGPLFRKSVNIPPREHDITWDLRLEAVDPAAGQKPTPFLLSLRIEADAQVITTREKELMAWRERVDPATQSDLVRAKVAELTDDEVYYYTDFQDRATFLKYWQRARAADLPRSPRGAVIAPPGARGLFTPGMPLPNGKFLHHPGNRPLPLPE